MGKNMEHDMGSLDHVVGIYELLSLSEFPRDHAA